MFALLASRPEYQKAIVEPYIAMAPVAHIGHVRTPLRLLADAYVDKIVQGVDKLLITSNGEFLPGDEINRLVNHILKITCQRNQISNYFCRKVSILNSLLLNISNLDTYTTRSLDSCCSLEECILQT